MVHGLPGVTSRSEDEWRTGGGRTGPHKNAPLLSPFPIFSHGLSCTSSFSGGALLVAEETYGQ